MARLAVNGGAPQRTESFHPWPYIDDQEVQAVSKVLEDGTMGRIMRYGTRGPSLVNDFRQAWLSAYPGKEYAIPCASGCSALELALRNAGVGPGDEVITPASTWVATNLAPLHVGADVVFADISPVNYCIGADSIRASITPRTKAVIVVHVGGYCCEMDTIMRIARDNNLVVIEDCAQSHGSKYKDRYVGNWGHFGCVSFDAGKLISAGEGGLLLCDDEDLGEWVYGVCGQSGESIEKLMKGRKVDGWNYRMTEYQAALLLVQLSRAEDQKQKRSANAEYLRQGMAGIPGLTNVPCVAEQNYYTFMFKYNKDAFGGILKRRFEEALSAEGLPVFCSPGNQEPVYRSPFFHSDKDYSGEFCPVAEHAYEEEAVGFISAGTLLGSKDDMDDILNAIRKVSDNKAELL